MKKLVLFAFVLAGCSTTTPVPVTDQPKSMITSMVARPIVIPEISDNSAPDFASSSEAFRSQYPECFPAPENYRAWNHDEAPVCVEKMKRTRIKSHGIEMEYGEYLAR